MLMTYQLIIREACNTCAGTTHSPPYLAFVLMAREITLCNCVIVGSHHHP